MVKLWTIKSFKIRELERDSLKGHNIIGGFCEKKSTPYDHELILKIWRKDMSIVQNKGFGSKK